MRPLDFLSEKALYGVYIYAFGIKRMVSGGT